MPDELWSPAAIATFLTGLAAIITSATLLFKSVLSKKVENRKTDSEASKNYAEAASLAAKRATELEEKVDNLEEIIDDLLIRTKALQDELDATKLLVVGLQEDVARYQKEVSRYKDWSQRLSGQIKKLGVEPVKIKKATEEPSSLSP